ncbi:hypothetical protein Scep_018866 [Stephania cephalantha]|uniref:Uncharacterized protein n=1 Tax=Stephania cephalantha TaxID=152367 RepID=A0AAP0I9X7_9MAGN
MEADSVEMTQNYMKASTDSFSFGRDWSSLAEIAVRVTPLLCHDLFAVREVSGGHTATYWTGNKSGMGAEIEFANIFKVEMTSSQPKERAVPEFSRIQNLTQS